MSRDGRRRAAAGGGVPRVPRRGRPRQCRGLAFVASEHDGLNTCPLELQPACNSNGDAAASRQRVRSRLEIYTDSSFADKLDDERKSRTGVLVLLDGCPVYWKSKRQEQTAVSTHEAELYALFTGTREAIHFRGLHKDLGFAQPGPTPIYVDNRAVTFTANSEVVTSAHRHIDVRYFRCRDHVRSKEISVEWVSGAVNPADLFTKLLQHDLHGVHSKHIACGVPYPPQSIKLPKRRACNGGDEENEGPAFVAHLHAYARSMI